MNKSYDSALTMLGRGFHVFPAWAGHDINDAKDRATNHLRVAEVLNTEDRDAPWFLRCRTRDELACVYAPYECDLRELERRWGVTFPNTWAIKKTDGRVYLLYSMDADGPVFHTYEKLAGTKVALLLYAPLPNESDYQWVPCFSPSDLALAALPRRIVSKLPTKHASAPLDNITSRVVQRAEFNPEFHKRQHERRY